VPTGAMDRNISPPCGPNGSPSLRVIERWPRYFAGCGRHGCNCVAGSEYPRVSVHCARHALGIVIKSEARGGGDTVLPGRSDHVIAARFSRHPDP
jgi:hypothetical protein